MNKILLQYSTYISNIFNASYPVLPHWRCPFLQSVPQLSLATQLITSYAPDERAKPGYRAAIYLPLMRPASNGLEAACAAHTHHTQPATQVELRLKCNYGTN